MPVNKHVLVVDFEPRRAAATAKWLEAQGYTVTLAVDAPSLDDVLLTSPPPLAVVEPMLPGRDGFELCRLLKQGLYGSRPRVVLASRLLRGPRYKSLAQGVGADLFVERPGQDGVLLAALEKLAELGAETAAPSSAPSPVGNRTGANRTARSFPRSQPSGSVPAPAAPSEPRSHTSQASPPRAAQPQPTPGDAASIPPAASLSGATSDQSSELDRMLDDVFNEIVGEDPAGAADATGAEAPATATATATATAVKEVVTPDNWDEGLVEELSGPASGALSLGDAIHDEVSAPLSEIERELSGAFSGESQDAKRSPIPLASQESAAVSTPTPAPAPKASGRTTPASGIELSEPVPGVEPAATIAGPATGEAAAKRGSTAVVEKPVSTPPAPARPRVETPAPVEPSAAPESARPAARTAETPLKVAPDKVETASGGRGKVIGALVAVGALAAIAAGVYVVFFTEGAGPAAATEAATTAETQPLDDAASDGAVATLATKTPADEADSPPISETPLENPGAPAKTEANTGARTTTPSTPAPERAAVPAKTPERQQARATPRREPAPAKANPAAQTPPPATTEQTITTQQPVSTPPESNVAVKKSESPSAGTSPSGSTEEPSAPALAPVEEPPVSIVESEPVSEDPLALSSEETSPVEEITLASEAASQAQPEPATPESAESQDIGPLLAGVNGVSDPELIADSRVPPQYPARATQLGHRGKCRVILEVMIGANGRVKSMNVLQEQVPHMGFANEAKSAVGQWRFIPARLNGKPVEVKKTIVINFDR